MFNYLNFRIKKKKRILLQMDALLPPFSPFGDLLVLGQSFPLFSPDCRRHQAVSRIADITLVWQRNETQVRRMRRNEKVGK